MENINITKEASVASQPQVPVVSLVKEQAIAPNLINIQIGGTAALLGSAAVLISVGVAWGTLKTLVSGVKNTLDKEVAPDLKNIRERFGIVEDRVETLWKDKLAPANSPRQLNEKGSNILVGSGIKEIVDEKKEKLLELVRAKNVKNAYDAEEAIEQVMMELPDHCPDIVDRLKSGAFKVGADIGGLLFVGSIYLRNQIFVDLGFSLDDLDRPKN